MHRVILAGIACVALAGCSLPTTDMMSNQYMDHSAEPVPAGMAGDWTGTSGPYLVTLRLNADGTGALCNSYGTSNYLQAAKYQGGTLYVQDGARLGLTHSGDTIVGMAPYSGSKPIRFVRDEGLKEAPPYCRTAL